MRVTTIHGERDIRLENHDRPVIERPTDAIVRVAASCVCGSDLWPYRAAQPIDVGATIGHEAVGVVEEVGSDVRSFAPGDFVIVPFCHCDNTCPHCLAGVTSACQNIGFTQGGQGEYIRVVQAEGTLFATGGRPDDSLLPSVLTLSDVMPTGWHAAVSARVSPGSTVVVVGDGAVGLCGVLAAAHMGAERVIALSRHAPRQAVATRFGATHIVAERGDEAIAAVMDLTDGVGADAVLECVGTDDSMKSAFSLARAGATVGFVGAPHGVRVPVGAMFARNVGLHGGIAPVRHYLPHLLPLVLEGTIDPGLVFDLTLPLDDVAEAYRAMDERRAIKVFLTL